MKALPSIAFNDFSGTAGDVTARATKSGTVLTVRPFPSKVVTPVQKVKRNALSAISRSYRELSEDQMAAWARLAEHLKGISTLGTAAEMTAHNAYVRLNSNRQLLGMSLLSDAPDYRHDIPEVDYDDFWVTPTMILFTGIEKPQDSYRLVMKMSGGQSNGISSGWSKTVIVAPGIEDDWGEANVTRLYTSAIGYTPQEGEKVFIELWWMDSDTGLVGETMRVKAIVKADSQVEGETYEPRNEATLDNIATIERGDTISKYMLEQADGSPIMTADIEVHIAGIVSGVDGDLQGLSDTGGAGRCYFTGRGIGSREYAIGLYETYTQWSKYWKSYQVAARYGKTDMDFLAFGTSCMVNF